VDTLTHAFTGIAVAHAVSRDPPAPQTLAAAAVAANLADVDWWTVSRSVSAYFELHRGVCHSIVAVPLLGGVVAGGFHAIARRSTHPERSPQSLLWLMGLCLTAAASHLLLDALNPYGLRPFLPFVSTWYYGDLAAIPDPWIWLILGSTVLLLTERGLVTTQIWAAIGGLMVFGSLHALPWEGVFGVVGGLAWMAAAAIVLGCWLRGAGRTLRRPLATAGLTLAVLYIGLLSVLHQQAIGRVQETAKRLAGDVGEPVGRVVAIPTIGDFTTWRGLAETNRSVFRFPVWLSTEREGQAERFTMLQALKADGLPDVWSEPPIRAFLGFARFVAGSVEENGGQRLLLLADPRFDVARPGEPGTWPIRWPLAPATGVPITRR
jgi:membrane-bound metal-dependent hydrolase YbcI (DUF457 family)